MTSKLPLIGEYFVYKLNPAETLALIHDDPDVAEGCKALQSKCKKYIGCCIAWCGIPVLGSLAPIKMSLVSRGLVAQPNGVIPADMSVPILPTTYHPRNRKPLIVDPPLPWDDCYHLTLSEMTVRIRYTEWSSRPRGKYALLPRGQTAILDGYQSGDEEWRAKLKYMKETGGTDLEPDPLEDGEALERYYEKVQSRPDRVPINAGVSSPFGGEPRNSPDGAQDKESETYSDEEELTEPGSSIHSSIPEVRSALANFDYATALDITLDLETVPSDELADNVYDFYAELKELGSIILAYVKKKKAQLADVQRQDAEFDAKVALARQSHQSNDVIPSLNATDVEETTDDFGMKKDDVTPHFPISGTLLSTSGDDHCVLGRAIHVLPVVSATSGETSKEIQPQSLVSSETPTISASTKMTKSKTYADLQSKIPNSPRLLLRRFVKSPYNRMIKVTGMLGSQAKLRMSLWCN